MKTKKTDFAGRPRFVAAMALAVATSFGFPMAVLADPAVTVDGVRQHWPWNNKVDVSYTVASGEGQDVANGDYKKVVFTATIGAMAYTIDGNELAAPSTEGRHVVTWNAPAGLKGTNCTMTAELVTSDVPSGDDYMIVDLVTDAGNGLAQGRVVYEGLKGTGTDGQNASNTRYNTDAFKTSRMVFRKIPKWADHAALPNVTELERNNSVGYPTGRNNDTTAVDGQSYKWYDANPFKRWQTGKDYYIAIFMTTEAQYRNLVSSYNSSTTKPVGSVSWVDLRGDIAADAVLARVSEPNTGTFLQRLSYITGNEYPFDLPTWLMSELAVRAGCRTESGGNGLLYWYGNSADNSKQVYTGGRAAVGSKDANAWGLYDANGNGFEWVLDDSVQSLSTLTDVFTARCNGTDYRMKRNGGGASANSVGGNFQANRGEVNKSKTENLENCGHRVAMIPPAATGAEWTSSAGGTFDIDTDATSPFGYAKDGFGVKPVTWETGDSVTVKKGEATVTLVTDAVSAGSGLLFATSPSSGGWWTLEKSSGKSVIVCVPWQASELGTTVASSATLSDIGVDTVQTADNGTGGIDRRGKMRELPRYVAFSGDEWAGAGGQSCTLKFTAPDSTVTSVERSGTGALTFVLDKPGTWTVELVVGGTTVRKAEVNATTSGFILIVK